MTVEPQKVVYSSYSVRCLSYSACSTTRAFLPHVLQGLLPDKGGEGCTVSWVGQEWGQRLPKVKASPIWIDPPEGELPGQQ